MRCDLSRSFILWPEVRWLEPIVCENIRLGCISRSEKGNVFCEDGTCPVIAGVSGVRAVATIAGPIVSTRLTVIDHITHLWLIIVDPIIYLRHSTTM